MRIILVCFGEGT